MSLNNEQQAFRDKIGAAAQADMPKSGILASLTAAQGILESGWGTSALAVKANNFFGMKSGTAWMDAVADFPTKEFVNGKWAEITAPFRKYPDMAASIADHSALFNMFDRYKPLRGETDYKKACAAVYAAGYATDPDYANKLISVIETYDLTQFDNKKGEKTMATTTFTGAGLAAHAKKALAEKWFYGWGSYGQKATASLINTLCNEYDDNLKWRTYMNGAVNKTRLCDCYGLVKSYLWWRGDESSPLYESNGFEDRNTSAAFNAAAEKGAIANMPDISGVILYMTGHVGVYVGNGEFIELAGGGVGARKGTITNGKITSGSRFTDWFKDTYINYSNAALSAAAPSKSLIRQGCKVIIKQGATYGGSANNKPVPAAQLSPKTHTVSKIQTNNGQEEALLSEITSWVPTKFVSIC